jgi:hypothetical protein
MKEDNMLHVHYSLANNDNDEKEEEKRSRRVASVAIGNKKENEENDEKVTSMRLILTCESYFAVGFFFSSSI